MHSGIIIDIMEKKLRARTLDIEVGNYQIILRDEDAKDLGLHPRDRVKLAVKASELVAIVNTTKNLLKRGEIGVPAEVRRTLKIKGRAVIAVSPSERPASIAHIKKKMNGEALSEAEYGAIVRDVVSGNISGSEIAAFITSLYINKMDMDECAALAKKMAEMGERLHFKKRPVVDKHSIGGVPGNKITLLIVPIVAAAGLVIPKTSSRAITSACGTADIMEVLAPVTFSAREIEEMVNKTNGAIVWGGGVNLAPADDIFIRVEYPLAIDPHYLALCSVMAKKYAVGASYVAIDIPSGTGTKAESMEEASMYAKEFMQLGEKLGIKVECAITFGDKPVGRAVGPALEAREALAVLETGAGVSSLIEKSTEIAGMILEAGGAAPKGAGKAAALEYISSGKALNKMKEIIAEQGGDKKITSQEIKVGRYSEKVCSIASGYVTHINNRAIVQAARAAGAPRDKGAGVLLQVSKGTKVEKGDTLYEIFADSEHKLSQALELAEKSQTIVLEGMVLKRISGMEYFER